ncbi:hypothetical protein J437_LFUL002689 [Ladona fulva]|uniref:ubiquitinyl hydrolase 1 n=1 Tax=Ladona fulva TaxID=123851 RepID=A0A8K0K1H1_LADFU|nr:hypothetical protein J437_LFUL002689 [Ladona fulva]
MIRSGFALTLKMEVIFHEKQEGSLCAQHCLNALLQGPYFSPVELATLAQRMDDEERKRMAESGVDSDTYKKFLEQPSGNMDDSGYFSVQVISSALEVWGLDLVPYNSSEEIALIAQKCPTDMQAYICNYRDHWFTIRRLGNQWFNLNSMLTGPELLSNTYLAMFLAQLQQEGYSIFIVKGILPESDADNLLRVCPAVQKVKPQLIRTAKNASCGASSGISSLFARVGNVVDGESSSSSGSKVSTESDKSLKERTELLVKLENSSFGDEDDEDLQRAIIASKADAGDEQPSALFNGDDEQQLQEALRLSLEVNNASPEPLARVRIESPDDEGDEELQRALKMSLECCKEDQASSQLNAEDVRQRRLDFFESSSPAAAISQSSRLNNPTT